jgi:hypothetical protein
VAPQSKDRQRAGISPEPGNTVSKSNPANERLASGDDDTAMQIDAPASRWSMKRRDAPQYVVEVRRAHGANGGERGHGRRCVSVF